MCGVRIDKSNPSEGFVARDAGAPVKDEKPEQGDDRAEGGQHHIFPSRFQRLGRILEADQKRGQQRGELHRDPHQRNVSEHGYGEHREHEEVVEAVIALNVVRAVRLSAIGDIAPGKQRRGESDQGHKRQDERAKPVAGQPVVQSVNASGARRLDRHHHSEHEDDRSRSRCERSGETSSDRRQRESAGDHWNEEDRGELHNDLNAPAAPRVVRPPSSPTVCECVARANRPPM